ncbi:hypothetical protein DIPPA_34017 [Diplonema papillatum]|nr:hypothetical protein DIPPA_34017 [Diplonema papillatum]
MQNSKPKWFSSTVKDCEVFTACQGNSCSVLRTAGKTETIKSKLTRERPAEAKLWVMGISNRMNRIQDKRVTDKMKQYWCPMCNKNRTFISVPRPLYVVKTSAAEAQWFFTDAPEMAPEMWAIVVCNDCRKAEQPESFTVSTTASEILFYKAAISLEHRDHDATLDNSVRKNESSITTYRWTKLMSNDDMAVYTCQKKVPLLHKKKENTWFSLTDTLQKDTEFAKELSNGSKMRNLTRTGCLPPVKKNIDSPGAQCPACNRASDSLHKAHVIKAAKDDEDSKPIPVSCDNYKDMWIIKICPMCNNCNNTTPFAIHAEYSLDPIVYKLVYTEVPVTLKSSEIDWITNVGLIFKFTSLSTCFLRALGDFMCDKDPEGLGKTVNDIVDFFDFSQSDEEPEPGGSEDNGETLPAGTQSEDKIVGNVLRVFSKLQEAVHEEHFGNDFGDILDLFKTYTSNLTRDAEVHQLQSNQPDHSQPRDGSCGYLPARAPSSS